MNKNIKTKAGPHRLVFSSFFERLQTSWVGSPMGERVPKFRSYTLKSTASFYLEPGARNNQPTLIRGHQTPPGLIWLQSLSSGYYAIGSVISDTFFTLRLRASYLD